MYDVGNVDNVDCDCNHGDACSPGLKVDPHLAGASDSHYVQEDAFGCAEEYLVILVVSRLLKVLARNKS